MSLRLIKNDLIECTEMEEQILKLARREKLTQYLVTSDIGYADDKVILFPYDRAINELLELVDEE